MSKEKNVVHEKKLSYKSAVKILRQKTRVKNWCVYKILDQKTSDKKIFQIHTNVKKIC